ncbi:MAG: hypothetical protein AAB358_03460 [Patescibacteria group bacterium]
MLNTSQDLFWLVLSFVVFWVGITIGWSGIYVALMLRDIKKVTGSFRKKMEMIDNILDTIKKKVEATASYLPPLLDGVGKIVEHFQEKKESKKKK